MGRRRMAESFPPLEAQIKYQPWKKENTGWKWKPNSYYCTLKNKDRDNIRSQGALDQEKHCTHGCWIDTETGEICLRTHKYHQRYFHSRGKLYAYPHSPTRPCSYLTRFPTCTVSLTAVKNRCKQALGWRLGVRQEVHLPRPRNHVWHTYTSDSLSLSLFVCLSRQHTHTQMQLNWYSVRVLSTVGRSIIIGKPHCGQDANVSVCKWTWMEEWGRFFRVERQEICNYDFTSTCSLYTSVFNACVRTYVRVTTQCSDGLSRSSLLELIGLIRPTYCYAFPPSLPPSWVAHQWKDRHGLSQWEPMGKQTRDLFLEHRPRPD